MKSGLIGKWHGATHDLLYMSNHYSIQGTPSKTEPEYKGAFVINGLMLAISFSFGQHFLKTFYHTFHVK